MLFPYFELFASLFILLLCFQIFTRHYESKVARSFALFLLVAFLATILEYSMRIAFTLEFARALNRISGSLWAFAFSLFASFAFVFTKKNKFLEKPWAPLFFYVPPTIFTILFLFTNLMYTRYEIWNIGIISQPSPWYWLFFIQTIFYPLLGIILFFHYAFTSPQALERIQAMVIAIGSTIPIAVGGITDELLPLVQGQRTVFPTCVFDIAILSLFVYIAMRSYSLFSISPSIAADVIIETMPDSLIATDLESKILFINSEACKLLRASSDVIIGKPLFSFFKDREKFEKLFVEVVKRNQEILRYEVELRSPLGETIPVLINANLLRDKIFGGTIGGVFIIHDIRG